MNGEAKLLDDIQLAAINEALEPIQRALLQKQPWEESGTLPTLFIIGAPRSGSTLLTQLLARATSIGFINNLTARFWRAPVLAMALQMHAGGLLTRERFDSDRGATFGMEQPSEFGFFWRRWFAYNDSHAVDADMVARIDQVALRSEIAGMSHAASAPMMFKNLAACGMNARFLATVIPQSVFLVVLRDRLATARSILRARYRTSSDFGTWFSVRPPDSKRWPTPPPPTKSSGRSTPFMNTSYQSCPALIAIACG